MSPFSLDSALMRGLTVLADLMVLNLLFIVSALPLVTLGPALVALNATAMRIGTGECDSVSLDYVRSFRADFRQAIAMSAVLGGLGVVLAAWLQVLTSLPLEPITNGVLLAVWGGMVATWAGASLFAFPYLARFEGTTLQVLGNACRLALAHPFSVLLAVVLIGASVAVTVLVPAATGYGLAWLLVGFSGIATTNGLLMTRIFNRLIAAAAPDPEPIP